MVLVSKRKAQECLLTISDYANAANKPSLTIQARPCRIARRRAIKISSLCSSIRYSAYRLLPLPEHPQKEESVSSDRCGLSNNYGFRNSTSQETVLRQERPA